MLSVLCVQAVVAASPFVAVWCTTGLDNVYRDTPRPTAPATALDMRAARGQMVGAQVVVRAEGGSVRLLGATCSSLQGPHGASISKLDFRWAYVDFCHVEKNSTATPPEELLRKAPADFPDALSEETERPVDAGQTQPVWVAVRVPERAAPGEYRGTVTLRTDHGDRRAPIRLTVYDFDFPADTRLDVTIWTNPESLAKHQKVDPDSEAWWLLLARVAHLMREHHQNTILTPWSQIRARHDALGAIVLDFSRLDRWIETFLHAGFRRIELAHMGGRATGEWEDPVFAAATMACVSADGTHTEALQMEDWLPALQEHLRAKGWLGRCVLHIADEPIAVNVASWKSLSERVHRLAPDLPRVDAVHVPDLTGHLEVWVPQLNYLQDWLPQFKAAQRAGVTLWYYTAWVPQGRFPNRLMDYPLIKTRILHWVNFTSGATGYLHWGFNFWDVPFDKFAPGDNNIVWPGKEAPRSSLRYEAMREGIEDYEYLCMLEDAASTAAVKLGLPRTDGHAFAMRLATALVPTFEGFSRDQARLADLRDAVARSIVVLRGPAPALATATRDGGFVRIGGRAEPGARLSCGAARATAGKDGSFVLRPASADSIVVVTIRGKKGESRLPIPVG